MATVTLSFSVSAGNYPLAPFATKVAGVQLTRGELDLIGMFVQSDTTAVDGSEVSRTLVLETTDAGDENFPDVTSLAYATKNLYRQTLALGIPAQVVAADPVAVA